MISKILKYNHKYHLFSLLSFPLSSLYTNEIFKITKNDNNIPQSLKYSYPFKQTTLSNGIRICTEHFKSPITSIGIFVNSGSRFEAKNASGSAHFLEHILFKGTKYQTKHQFEYEIESSGSNINAYTSREHTLFHIECFPQNAKRSIEILSQMMQYPLISKRAITDEKDTIKAELINSYSDPVDFLMEMGHQCAFGVSTAMGRPILGEISNIYNITQNMVISFHKRQYISNNLIIVTCGDIKHEDLVSDVYTNFKYINKKAIIPYDKEQENFSLSTPKFNHSNIMYIYNEKCNTPGICVLYKAPSWYDKDYYALMLIERILGNYISDIGRYRAFFNPYRDIGIFGILAVGSEEQLTKEKIVRNFFPFEYGNFINDYTIERAKNKLYMELLNIQSPIELLYLIGPQILYLNRRVSKYEIAKRVSYISNEYIRNMFIKYFINGRPCMVALGKKSTIDNIVKENMQCAYNLLMHNKSLKH